MGDLRLYMGAMVLVHREGATVTQLIEKFIGWHNSEDAARGEWVAQATSKHPGYAIEGGVPAHDITDIARQVPE